MRGTGAVQGILQRLGGRKGMDRSLEQVQGRDL